MSNQIEGVVVPATYPTADYGGQLALWADSWVREWRSCLGTVMISGDSVTIGALVFFRGDTLERLGDDDAYPPHLRIYSREELDGARKMLQRLLVGNPRGVSVIAEHLLAEARPPKQFSEGHDAH